MLIYKKGDILNATEKIICHQVNVQGCMGGGLAKQIATTYPNVERLYQEYCKNYDYEILKGDYLIVQVKPNQYIANCFTQKPNFDTDYEALKICFSTLLNRYRKPIAVPYGYGSGIANGDWAKIENIFKELSEKYKVNMVMYKL